MRLFIEVLLMKMQIRNNKYIFVPKEGNSTIICL